MRLKRFSSSKLEDLIARGIIHMKDPEGGDGGGSNGGEGDDAEGDEGEGEDGDPGDAEGQGSDGGSSDGAGDDEDDGEGDGGEKPTDREAKLLKEVMKHKGKAREALEASKKVQTDLNNLKAALGDLKPEDISQIVADRKQQKIKDQEKRGEYDRIVEQMRNENQAALNAVGEELKTKKAELATALETIESLTVGREFSDSAFIRENSALPPSIARKEFGEYFDNVDGVVVGYDKPRGSENRTPLVDANGNPKKFNDAIKQLFEGHPDSKSLLRAKAKPGSQSKTVADPGKGADKGTTDSRSPRDKIRAGLSAS